MVHFYLSDNQKLFQSVFIIVAKLVNFLVLYEAKARKWHLTLIYLLETICSGRGKLSLGPFCWGTDEQFTLRTVML